MIPRVLLLSAAAVCLVVQAASATGGYKSRCPSSLVRYYKDSGVTELSTSGCNFPGAKDVPPASTLKLNHCLANVDGRLLWAENGMAMESCKDCQSERFNTNVMTCQCINTNKQLVQARIDLNEEIYADQTDGILGCFNIRGKPSGGDYNLKTGYRKRWMAA